MISTRRALAWTVIAFALGLVCGSLAFGQGVSTAHATQLALTDCRSLPPDVAARTRYLLVADDKQSIAVSYVINAVSRNGVVVRPLAVGNGALLRFDLADLANYRQPDSYASLHAAWESIAARDPYFGVITNVIKPGESNPSTLRVTGGWIGLDTAEALAAASGSSAAILRADFFVAQVAGDAYYDWAGIPATEAEFFASLGVDTKQHGALAADTAANLFLSNVTHDARRIILRRGPYGGSWQTKDIAKNEGPHKDPIRAPVNYREQQFKHDASEHFALRANRFWGVAVFDAVGRRQATVADEIAKDAYSLDGIVRPLVSCVRCHEREGEAGLQSFTDDQFPLLSGEQAILQSYDPAVAQRIGELYQPQWLMVALARDRADHAAAVQAACGCTPKEAVAALSAVWDGYVEQPVTREKAAAELGVTVERLVEKTVSSNDPVILALRSGEQVNRTQFEASWQELSVRCSP